MIYIRKKEEVRISALLALFSIPISIFLLMLFARTESILKIIFFPVVIVVELLKYLIGPLEPQQHWLWGVVGLLAQYLAYFLFIYLSLRILRKLKITGEPSIPKEQSEKDPPPHVP